jgi:ferredoxin-type protein NapG
MGDRDRLNSLLTRRAFVDLVGKGAVVVALGGFIRFLGRKENFIRPPAALPEEEFLSLCTRCLKCQEVCPTRVIAPVLLTESVISVGTPKLDSRRRPCIHCGYCSQVCPTGALRWWTGVEG